MSGFVWRQVGIKTKEGRRRCEEVGKGLFYNSGKSVVSGFVWRRGGIKTKEGQRRCEEVAKGLF